MSRPDMLKEFRRIRNIYTGGFDIHILLAYSKYSGPEWLDAIEDNESLISISNDRGIFLGLTLPNNLAYKVYDTIYSSSDPNSPKLMYLRAFKMEHFEKTCAEIGIGTRYIDTNIYYQGNFVRAARSFDPITDTLMQNHGFYRDKASVIDANWK